VGGDPWGLAARAIPARASPAPGTPPCARDRLIPLTGNPARPS